MYLGGGIVTIADITNAKGDYIDHDMYKGNPRTTSKWHRVTQSRPDANSWAQWRRATRLFSTKKEQQLLEPLGNWTVPKEQIRQPWKFWHDDNNALYQQQQQGYTKHK